MYKMKNISKSISLWFSIIMVLVVIAGIFAFTFTDFMSDKVYGNKRIVMIVVFTAYALFRGSRIYQVLSAPKNEDE